MRTHFRMLAAAATGLLLATAAQAQQQGDASIAVAGGGIKVAGWQGKIDAREAGQGMTINDAMFMAMGGGFHVRTGPAVTYWNPANTATGNYTVKATFREPQYQNLNNHPHPYGIVIGGTDLGTENQNYIYCSAYGNGTFIVRGFGPEPFQVSERRPTAHDAINKAAARNEPVTQEIALSVKGDKIECAINGTVVASYNKSDVLGAGRLKSTDGVYGIRFGHNTEVMVTGFGVTRH